MLKTLIRRHLQTQRDFILSQVAPVQGLMRLLMKPQNTGLPRTREETRQIRAQLKAVARLVPTLLVFLLPGGLLLLPILAEVLDRRRASRG
jgi:hypothetical protein